MHGDEPWRECMHGDNYVNPGGSACMVICEPWRECMHGDMGTLKGVHSDEPLVIFMGMHGYYSQLIVTSCTATMLY